MIFSPPPRNFRAELLDLDEAPFEEVRDSLSDVRKVNRYLSGYRVLLTHAAQFLRSHPENRPLTVLDVATGSADQPAALIRQARRMKVPVRVLALDINHKMLLYAREMTARLPEIRLVQGDVFSLPFADNSIDLIINSLSLHHFAWDDAVKILKSMHRICRMGFIVNDLNRSRVAHASIFLLTRLLTKNRLTRYDAPVSVMNAFTPDEFKKLAEQAGIERYEIHRHFPYRIAFVVKKDAAAATP